MRLNCSNADQQNFMKPYMRVICFRLRKITLRKKHSENSIAVVGWRFIRAWRIRFRANAAQVCVSALFSPDKTGIVPAP
jgi:hypothetical protein